jgi:hypothetical protein
VVVVVGGGCCTTELSSVVVVVEEVAGSLEQAASGRIKTPIRSKSRFFIIEIVARLPVGQAHGL